MPFDPNLSRDELVKRLRMRFVSTIGTKGTIVGCSEFEACSMYRRDWAEDIYDYVKYFQYNNVVEMIESELSTYVRVVRRPGSEVRFCAVASPDLEHCFRLIDHPRPKVRNGFSFHFPSEMQRALPSGQSRFSRSNVRRTTQPPLSPGVQKITNAFSRPDDAPIYVRRNSIAGATASTNANAANNNANGGLIAQSADSGSRFSQSQPVGSRETQKTVRVARKEFWQLTKKEREISPFYMQIFESITAGRNDPRIRSLIKEVEKSRAIDAPTIDCVNRKTYASDDELLADNDQHYFDFVKEMKVKCPRNTTRQEVLRDEWGEGAGGR